MQQWCRPHLVAALRRGEPVDVEREAAGVRSLLDHLRQYARSFRWEYRNTETVEDRAALIGALGWCSGWGDWLELTDRPDGIVEPPAWRA